MKRRTQWCGYTQRPKQEKGCARTEVSGGEGSSQPAGLLGETGEMAVEEVTAGGGDAVTAAQGC